MFRRMRPNATEVPRPDSHGTPVRFEPGSDPSLNTAQHVSFLSAADHAGAPSQPVDAAAAIASLVAAHRTNHEPDGLQL